MVTDTSRGFGLEAVPSFSCATVMFLDLVVLMRQKGGEETGCVEKKSCFARDRPNDGGLLYSIGLWFQCLITWWR